MNIAKILGKLPLPPELSHVRQAKLHADEPAAHVHSDAEVRQAIDPEFSDAPGWVCFASQVWLRQGGETLPTDQGFILSAEFALEKASLHIRRNPAGGWSLVTIREEASDDESSWILTRNFARYDWQAYRKSGDYPTVAYYVCWDLREGNAYQPRLSRFAGFGTQSINS